MNLQEQDLPIQDLMATVISRLSRLPSEKAEIEAFKASEFDKQ